MSNSILIKNSFGSIKQSQLNGNVSTININHYLGSAVISLYGGQVLNWQPKNQRPVFWLSEKAEFGTDKAIRGGVPLCWPWFGPYSKDGITGGNHGFARQRNWQLTKLEMSQTEVKLTLELCGENEHDLWLSKFKVQQQLIFSDCFEQQLIIENLTNEEIKHSIALHSYFAVSHPKYVTVNSLSDSFFDDKISGKVEQRDDLKNCIGPIDRIYHSTTAQATKSQQIIDSHWQRSINVRSTNCQQWVLWNPGKDIAQSMPDIHQGGENEYICLEAANTQWQSIPPMGKVSIGQQVYIENI